MLLIFLTSVLETLVVIGIGLLAVRPIDWMLSHSTLDELGLTGIGVLGIVVTTTLSMLWNFLLPLDEVFAVSVLICGLAGLAIGAKTVARVSATNRLRAIDGPIVMAVLVIAAYIANRQYLVHGDTGLYHIPTILLDSSGPVLIGAANIHMRFGYNSSLYPLSGAFFYPVVTFGGAVIVNCMLSALFFGAILQSIPWNSLRRIDAIPAVAAMLVLSHIITYSAIIGGMGSPSTDWPAFLASAYTTLLCLQLVLSAKDPPSPGYVTSRLWIMCLTAAFSLTLKLTQSLTPLLAFIGMALPMRWRNDSRSSMLIGLVGATGIGVLWSVRGLLLSGCFAYPIRLTCVPSLPWTLPADLQKNDLDWMASTAKIPGGAAPDQVPELEQWFPTWFADLMTTPYMIYVAILLALAVVLVLARVVLRHRLVAAIEEFGVTQRLLLLCIVLVLLGEVGIWFVVAPLPRYGEASLYILASVLVAIATPLRPTGSQSFAGIVSLASARKWLILTPLLVYLAALDSFALLRRSLLTTDWPHVPAIKTEQVTTACGAKYHKPISGNLCWSAPPPCSPSYVANSAIHETKAAFWTMITRAGP